MKTSLKVVLAAGGNPTGIMRFDDSTRRHEYAGIAKKAMSADSSIEQFGFLEGEDSFHFQMSGGEFCGNAARAVALLISHATDRLHGQFTMSGFDGIVSYQVANNEVECRFPGLQMIRTKVSVIGVEADLIDMGGIVHVVLPFNLQFPTEVEKYRHVHANITHSLGLENKPAVGVIWREKTADGSIGIHPVVWVRDINSFFYETACGSGTLATLEVDDSTQANILQPSGESIHAEKQDGNVYTLRSSVTIQTRSET